MHPFSWAFLAMITLSLLVELWLNRRQSAYVSAHAEQVPDAFSDRISLKDHQLAARYTLARLKVGNLALIYTSLLLIGWTLGGGLQWVAGFLNSLSLATLLTGTLLLLAVMLLMSLLELPFAAWNTFVIEQRFGFNRQTPAGWLRDLLLQATLMIVIGAPLAALILWLMAFSGEFWWLYAWAAWTGFVLLMSWAYPVLIAPLFNRFEPLQDSGLRERLGQLLQRCGFEDNGMFVMDGSRRSRHGNAYFTGFGRNKRIVFFDTLLDQLEPEETEAVLAHELGHFKRRHILKRLVITSVLTLLGFALLGWMRGQEWFFTALGVSTSSDAMALLLFVMAVPVFTFFLQPVGAWFSRKHEFEADEFATLQASGAALVSALVKLYRDNASTLTPDPLYSSFHHSHPPAPVRIAHISSKLKAITD